MATPNKPSRKDQILQSLARMLETSPGARITTAALAKEVGVSEAALYRHFPSKARMFEGLIKFIEDTLFVRFNRILADEEQAEKRCEQIIFLLLTFADKNPGITRILIGDALAGETDRLRVRVAQIFDRIEAQLKQVLREAQIREGLKPPISPAILANLLLAWTEGKITEYVRSEFSRSPVENWEQQWDYIRAGLLVPVSQSQDEQTLTTSPASTATADTKPQETQADQAPAKSPEAESNTDAKPVESPSEQKLADGPTTAPDTDPKTDESQKWQPPGQNSEPAPAGQARPDQSQRELKPDSSDPDAWRPPHVDKNRDDDSDNPKEEEFDVS